MKSFLAGIMLILVVLGFTVSSAHYYIMYRVLEAIHADQTLMTIFWVYVPMAVVLQLIAAFIKALGDYVA